MGITSENVAERYGITRQEQDQAAVRFVAIDFIPKRDCICKYFLFKISNASHFVQVESHRKAAAAVAAGKFKEEIIPVVTKVLKA